MGTKARSTQHVVNCFPQWSDIRNDEQSLGYQLINSVAGIHLDDIQKHLKKVEDNYYLPTAVISDPDIFYSARLAADFEFTEADLDTTEMLYDAPTVSGLDNTTYYSVQAAENNDIDGFWFDAIPSRFTLEETVALSHVVASGYLVRSPFVPLTTSGLAHIPNRLTVTISGGQYYLNTVNGETAIGVVQIDGTTRAGVYLTEEIPFLYDDSIETIHEFTSVSGIRTYNISDPDTTFIWVKSAKFNDTFKPQAYDLEYDLANEEQKTYWGLSTSQTLGIRTLSVYTFDINAIDARLAGFYQRSSVLDIELLDTNGNTITPVDVIAEPHSDRLWVVSADKLYCYSAELPYGNMTLLSQKDYDSPTKIEPGAYYITRGESVTLDYVWRNPVQGLVKHRVWVQYPDGNEYSIVDGSITTYTSDANSWIWGEPFNRVIRASDTFTLSQLGDYVFCLETYFADETTTLDKRVVTVVSKTALAEFDLSDYGINTTVVGVDVDSEYHIWVMDSTEAKYRLAPHYDVMLIDYANKILYFREPYSLVRVLS